MNAPGLPMGEGTPRMLDVEFYIEAAEQHGADSETDHEVGDLQDYLRAMWAVLSEEQRRQFACSAAVADALGGAGMDCADDLAALQGKQPVGVHHQMTKAAAPGASGVIDIALYLYP